MKKQLVETHFCPADHDYYLVLDHREAVPDDPGAGTPAMVYGPRDACATYFRALNEGELDCHQLPGSVNRWLESMEHYVDAYVHLAFENRSQATISVSRSGPRL